jgi:hypothetical protein
VADIEPYGRAAEVDSAETIKPEIIAGAKRFVTGRSGAYNGAMPWSALAIDGVGPALCQ